MDPHEIVETIIVLSVVVVPALAVTARFALKPIVEAILRLKEGGLISGPGDHAAQQLVAEMRQLRGEISQMQRQINELKEGAEFHQALQEPAPGAALPAPKPE
jgi:TolA-binding protein